MGSSATRSSSLYWSIGCSPAVNRVLPSPIGFYKNLYCITHFCNTNKVPYRPTKLPMILILKQWCSTRTRHPPMPPPRCRRIWPFFLASFQMTVCHPTVPTWTSWTSTYGVCAKYCEKSRAVNRINIYYKMKMFWFDETDPAPSLFWFIEYGDNQMNERPHWRVSKVTASVNAGIGERANRVRRLQARIEKWKLKIRKFRNDTDLRT